ncbi:hypothetical protein [Actinocorallia aurea]
MSRHVISDPDVSSQAGTTTRNRDHASHAQNSFVRRPPILGASR